MKADFFIDRPVFSTVISIIIVIIGAIGLMLLPVDQYPQIIPPVVKVSASYPGASALTVTQAVATPIEQELNGTPGMLYMESTSSNTGGFSLNVTFDISTAPDLAAVEIQNRVKLAESRLPAEVVQNGISVEKQSSSKLLTITLLSNDPKFDEIYLSNYATLNVVDMLRRVPGVGRVSNVGSRYYAMQIWLMPDRLANLGLTVKDIQNALKDQNRESAAGVLGQAPISDVDITVPISTQGRLSSVTDFENIVVRSNRNGALIRLKDVARISLEASSYNTESGINGGNAAVLDIYMLPGSNAIEVADLVKKEMQNISRNFPDGISYGIPFDMTDYISQSIHHVYKTLFEALLLVILVVFLSLQSWRATLIPTIAVPISLIGTFGIMLIFGFTLNLMTLLGLVLAIGIVVDDAIVVVENVERIMNEERISAYEATKKAMNGLAGALIATSLVLCAVFVPVSFLSGITGQLYRQFTITIAVSVIISTVVALTLSPVMCSRVLKPHGGKKVKVFRLINHWLALGNRVYGNMIRSALSRPKRMYIALIVIVFAIWGLNRLIPTSFIPEEDQGYFTVELRLPEGAALERTRKVTERAMDYLMENPNVQYVLNVTGSSPRIGTNQASSQLTVILKPWKDRKERNIRKVMAQVRKELERYPESMVFINTPPVIPGMGSSGGFEMVLEARGETSYEELQNAVDTLLYYASQRPELTGVSSSMQKEIPQLYFDVDRDKAQMLGVPMSDIFSTMKAFTGSVYVNDFNMFNRIYKVYIQADAPYRGHRSNLDLFFVKGASGSMLPVTALGTTSYTTGPGAIKRFNMFNSATISGSAAQGYSSGAAMQVLEGLAREHLSENIGIEWSGLSFQEKKEGGQTGIILALAMLFVFLFLAAQYESWSVPVSVLLSLPIACVGAYLGVILFGLDNNVYFQIGLVMLIGLVAKNAILIVEFAKNEVEKGRDLVDSALKAAHLRFRPIVMTSLAFILGMLPLVFASGPSSESSRNISTGVFFGMLVAITAGIVFVPFFFVEIYRLKERISAGRRTAAGKVLVAAAILTAGLAGVSCSSMKRCADPQTGLPEHIVSGHEDSLSLADMEWWKIYSDTTLCSLIEKVLENNKDMLSAAAKVEQMRHLNRIDKAGFFPTVGAKGYADYESENYSGKDQSVDVETGLKLDFAWEIDLWGSIRWANRRGAAEYLASVEACRAMQMTLVSEVARAYFELIALDKELQIVTGTLETRREAIHQAQLRHEAGLTSEIPYQQAKVELASAATLVPDLQSRIAAKEHEISLLAGEYPGKVARASSFECVSLPKETPVGLPSGLLKRRPDIRIAEKNLAAAEAKVGIAWADRFPRLTINFSGGLENGDFAGLFTAPWMYAIGTLSSPVFQFGKKKARYEAEIAAYEQSRFAYEKCVLNAFREVNDALVKYENAHKTAGLQRSLLEATDKYFNLAKLQYINGSILYLDLLDAQRQYFKAEVDYSNAILSEYIAFINLYKALGGGWEEAGEE